MVNQNEIARGDEFHYSSNQYHQRLFNSTLIIKQTKLSTHIDVNFDHGNGKFSKVQIVNKIVIIIIHSWTISMFTCTNPHIHTWISIKFLHWIALVDQITFNYTVVTKLFVWCKRNYTEGGLTRVWQEWHAY